jgi:NAD(P)-dependent dehydrogenase (short-subunit alcohol dehydrogenase family)
MIKGGEEAHIVNTASVAGLMPGAGNSSYTASKFAVVGITEALYYELMATQNTKIGVSVLCPGAVDTKIIDSMRNHPEGRPKPPAEGTPEAIGLKFVRDALAAGMKPAELAGIVLDGDQAEPLLHPAAPGAQRYRHQARAGHHRWHAAAGAVELTVEPAEDAVLAARENG